MALGIPLESGVNMCEWNVNGKCTHPKMPYNVGNFQDGFTRSWDSTVNCVFTVEGVYACAGYEYDHHATCRWNQPLLPEPIPPHEESNENRLLSYL